MPVRSQSRTSVFCMRCAPNLVLRWFEHEERCAAFSCAASLLTLPKKPKVLFTRRGVSRVWAGSPHFRGWPPFPWLHLHNVKYTFIQCFLSVLGSTVGCVVVYRVLKDVCVCVGYSWVNVQMAMMVMMAAGSQGSTRYPGRRAEV